jgi:TusA-related sulfurtransferase
VTLKPILAAITAILATCACGQDRLSGVNQRGDHAMGFDHDKTTHHFRLYADGGVIEVTAKDPLNTSSVSQIRKHLGHIATSFAAGHFDMPMFIHDRIPPGVPDLQRLRDRIQYKLQEIPAGAHVRITTSDEQARRAIHDFLRFQIKDHQTGDPLDVGQVSYLRAD